MDDLKIVSQELPPLEELAPLWRKFDRLGAHDFFVTWTWLGTWLEVLPRSVRPQLLKAIKGEALVGLATLTLANGKLHGLVPVSQAWLNASGDPELDQLTIEHNGFASADVPPNELLGALVRSFADGQIGSDELLLPGVRGLDAPEPRLVDAGRLVPAFRVRLDALDGNHGIEPLLSPNARQQLRRSLRAVQRVGPITVDIAQDTITALRFFADLKSLHIRWWERRERRHAFSNAHFEKFHRILIPNGIRDKNIDLMRVSAGDHVLGYLYNFRRNGKISSYQAGFDETVLSFRPGYVCHAVAIRHYASAGMLVYDFLAGSNRLKQSFGVEQYELGWHEFRRKTTMFRIEAAARRLRAGLRRLKPNLRS